LTEAIKFYEVSRNAEYIGYAYKDIALCYYFMGDFHLAITNAENALKVSESSFDPRLYVIAVSVVSWAYAEFGLFGRAIEEGQKALNIAEKYSNNSLISYATYTIAYAFILKGDFDRAIEYCKQAVEKAQTPRDRLWSETYLGWALCRVGEPIKGIDHMTKLLLMSQASRFLPMELWIKFIMGEGYWLAGEREKSKQILENNLGLAERLKMKFLVAFAHRILGEISTTINPDKAAIHFDKSINAFKKIGAQNELSLTYASFAKLHKHQGNFAEARKHFKKALEIFERLGTLIEPEKVKKELADLRGR
jgi:tetratricopeptide (TPR) repeat protein